jgi:transposase
MDNTNTLTTQIINASACFIDCPFLAEKDAELEKVYAELEQEKAEKASLTSELEKLQKKYQRTKAAAATYKHMLFGKSSEKSSSEEEQTIPEERKTEVTDSPDKTTPNSSRKRGAKPGHKGHGRKIPEGLPIIHRTIEVPEEERFCPICGRECEEVTLTEDSSEIDADIQLSLVVTHRKRVKRTCDCEDAGPRFLTAPNPPQAIPKSKFSHNLLSLIIVLKYMFAVPLNRILNLFALQGVSISAGSITSVFSKCFTLFEPLYKELAKVSKQEKRWNVDETSWMSFTQLPGKKNYLAWMWVFVSQKVILYIWDPSRASRVPFAHFGQLARGFLTADRYGAYKKLAKMVPGLTIAFCWVHFRRDFIRAALSDKTLEPWAEQWKASIGEIFRLNEARLKDPALQENLKKGIGKMEETINAELADPTLSETQHKVLKSAQKHWEGLTVFVANPQVPMDNNAAERPLRNVALGRNNYYGTRAEWSSHFTAICLTLVKTARLHGLNPQAYLRYYLEGCAKAGGVPTDLTPYLPWNIKPDVLEGK